MGQERERQSADTIREQSKDCNIRLCATQTQGQDAGATQAHTHETGDQSSELSVRACDLRQVHFGQQKAANRAQGQSY